MATTYTLTVCPECRRETFEYASPIDGFCNKCFYDLATEFRNTYQNNKTYNELDGYGYGR